MKILTVCFFGHRIVNDFRIVEESVAEIIGELIKSNDYVDFLIGRNGDFDQIVSSSIIEAKKKEKSIIIL